MPFNAHDHQSVSAATPAPSPAAPAAGKRTLTAGLAPRAPAAPSSAVSTHLDGGLGTALSGTGDKAKHEMELQRLAERAEAAQRDEQPTEASATVAALVLQAAHGPVTALAAQARKDQEADQRIRGKLDDPFPFLADAYRDQLAEAEDNATPMIDAIALRSLDRLASVAHALAGAAPDASASVLGALGALGAVSQPLGWRAPTSTDEAATARGSREPCASDAAASDRCVWSPVQRLKEVDAVRDQLEKVADSLAAACAHEADGLRAMLKHEAAIAEAVADLLFDAIFDFVVKGGGGALKLAKAHGKEVAAEAAKAAATSMRDVMIDYAKDLGKDVAKAIIKDSHKAAGDGQDADPRERTIGVIESLPDVLKLSISRIDFDALDDEDIRELRRATLAAPGKIQKRVTALVASYRKNIEPLGQTSYGPGYPSVRKNVTRAARIRIAPMTPPRLALVTQGTDTHPEARKEVNDKVAAYATIGNAAWMVGDDTLGEVREAAKDTGERFTFIRWMDLPDRSAGLDLKAIAEADALDLPADRVIGLSLGDLMPARDDSAARSQ